MPADARAFFAEPHYGHPVRVCIELPRHAHRYRYAAAELLRRLRRDVVWVPRHELTHEDFYVGLSAPEVRCAAQVVLPQTLEALDNPSWMPSKPFFVSEGHIPLVYGSPTNPDWLASAFFWLSGWQERALPDRDAHGRFPYAASLQARWALPERPWVDLYAHEVGRWGITQRSLSMAHTACVIPTFDLDQLHARTLGLLYRRLRVRGMVSVLRTLWRDPVHETLRRIHAALQAHNGSGTCFVKAGATSRYDTPYALPAALRRIAPLSVALHPSYRAALDPALLQRERNHLCNHAEQQRLGVRSHYLRYDLAATPALHEEVGFAWDSTLGWAEKPGFRRATAHPFRVYDLQRDAPTPVLEVPLLVMDGSLFVYQRLPLEDAFSSTQALLQACRDVGGMATLLWHPWMWDDEMPSRGEHFEATLMWVRERNLPLLDLPSALHAYGFR